MVEVKDGKKILTTPISAEDLKGIKIGDIIYLNGSMTTCRDVAHRRLVEEGRELPVDVRNNAIFHAGPIIRPLENDKFEMVSVSRFAGPPQHGQVVFTQSVIAANGDSPLSVGI